MTEQRRAAIQNLKREHWDVLIVGGGINGAGIARDLTTRGANLKVALVERNHFSSGTSGRNSQLIHGGLRYLKYFDFNLVREALHERATLLRIAPALVSPLKFLLPCYGPIDRWFYGAGLATTKHCRWPKFRNWSQRSSHRNSARGWCFWMDRSIPHVW